MAKKVAKKKTKKVTKKTTTKTAKKVSSKKVVKKVAKKATKKIAKKTSKQSALVIQSVLPKVGEMAPNFKLLDQNGQSVELKDFLGSNVVVYFYPKAMTPGCTVQACRLRDFKTELKDQNIVVLGISPDPVKKLKAFEDKDHLNFTLLSDEDHQVAEAYGSWGLKKFMGREYMGVFRQSYLIDKNGKILSVMRKVDTKTHHDDVIQFFKHQG